MASLSPNRPGDLPQEIRRAASANGRAFVLVHGAWHGGWCWRDVASQLRVAGRTVFTPTQTGVGERRHLLSVAVGLDVFAQDVTNLLEAEELTDVILVGHSFGGVTITMVADRCPERIGQIVYLDGEVLEDGESAFDRLQPDAVAARRQAAVSFSGGLAMPPPPPSSFGVPPGLLADWLARRLTPHPIATYEQRLTLQNPLVGQGLPCTYVACTDPSYEPLASSRQRVQSFISQGLPWTWREIASGHDAMVLAPDTVAQVLLTIA